MIDPGTRFKYSNHGFALLGLAIEAVTGEAYKTWIKREIIAPAGPRETEPDMPIADDTPLACGHSGKLPLGRRVPIPGRYTTDAIAPAGGFVSTAQDLARFFSQAVPKGQEERAFSRQPPRDDPPPVAHSPRQHRRRLWARRDQRHARRLGLGSAMAVACRAKSDLCPHRPGADDLDSHQRDRWMLGRPVIFRLVL